MRVASGVPEDYLYFRQAAQGVKAAMKEIQSIFVNCATFGKAVESLTAIRKELKYV